MSHSKSCPADILIPNWFLGQTHLTSNHFGSRSVAKTAAQVTEARKQQANIIPNVLNLSGCVPTVAVSYGTWG